MRKTQIGLLLLAMLCSIHCLQAQSSATVSGSVTDANKKPLRSVTVALLNTADSSLLRTAITDGQGKFEMPASTGAYLLSMSMVGYQEKFSAVYQPGEKPSAPFVLETAGKQLEAVTVTAKKPMIEIKADKTIFNVEGSINATGSNALELLQKSPGVRVDNNENIGMKGKNGVKIYIDGKMSQLDSKDLAAYLKSINSNDVEAIEMISNPSAKYDASGNAGIINIRLKKNKKYGMNGSANVGLVQGVTPKGNAGINLNYRDKKINVFGTAGFYRGNYRNEQNIYRIQNDTIYDQGNVSISKNTSYSAKAGADYFIDKNNTLGVMASINLGDGEWANTSRTFVTYQPTGVYAKTLTATNNIPGTRTNFNSNINYRFTDSTGKEINVDADYGFFRGKGRSYQPNYYTDANNNDLYSVINRNNTPTNIDIYTIKADIEIPKWKGKFGYGAKVAYVKTNNTFEFFTDQNGVPVKNLQRSNRFKYIENVNAAYVNYQRELTKAFSLQAGLRAEQTNSEGDLTRDDGVVQPDNNITRSYINLFPSAALTYTLNDKNTLNVTYSRRIDRPSYQDLNPFENKLDELTYEKGNAFLRPQYTDNIELSHTFKGILTTTVGYSNVKDYRAQFIDTTNGNATFVQQRNLANQKIYSFSIGSSLPIAKWWSGYATVYANHQQFKGAFVNQNVNLSVNSYGGYLQNTFLLGKDYSAEISGWFNGPGLEGTIRGAAMGAADIGFQKQLLKKKATIKASFTDIFHTAKWSGRSEFAGLYAKVLGNWESQTFRLNFTYRFGSNQISNSRQRKTGLETEAGRIKGGN
jgi:iron complex outermembrane recepter protein